MYTFSKALLFIAIALKTMVFKVCFLSSFSHAFEKKETFFFSIYSLLLFELVILLIDYDNTILTFQYFDKLWDLTKNKYCFIFKIFLMQYYDQ